MLSYIFVGCVAIYVAAFLLRWVVAVYVKLTQTDPAWHNVRYATIGTATVLLMLIAAIGESRLNTPDYSYLWTFLVSGAIVFTLSVGYSYWTWRKAQRKTYASESAGTGNVAPDDLQHGEESPASQQDVANPEEWGYRIMAVVLAVAIVLVTSYDVEPETIPGVMLAPFLWLAEGFLAAITNPYYLGGLLVGIGTGWILRSAFPR